MQKEIAIPKEIKAELSNGLCLSSSFGKISRQFERVSIALVEGKICLSTPGNTRRDKRALNTAAAHIRNALQGLQKPWQYELKAVYSHFPFTVGLKNRQIEIRNFLGEKKPRLYSLPEGVSVELSGDLIRISSVDIEAAGRAASGLELLTRVKGVDRRVFQDGIYIVKKPKGK